MLAWRAVIRTVGVMDSDGGAARMVFRSEGLGEACAENGWRFLLRRVEGDAEEAAAGDAGPSEPAAG